ncbi:MAG TPA: AMP-binding protein, partial [Clostridiales bacterium]|nr:AMP-binding protein [Clostridiales bacterium]
VYNDVPYRRTWKEFNDECDVIARGLLELGVGKGDHVAVWATNVPEWLLTFYATIKIGAVLVTVNTAYKVFELEYLLRQSDSKVLVMIDGWKSNSYVDIVNELCPMLANQNPERLKLPMLPCLKNILYVGEKTPAGMLNFNVLYERAKETPPEMLSALAEQLNADEVINMQYTSGTTGFPKGVMLTHKNILNNGRFIGDNMKFTENDRLCITVPLFHCFGMVLAMMACISHASTMVPVDMFNAEKVMRTLDNQKCTAVHGVPTMFIAMLEHPDFSKYNFSHLRTGIMAGSPCPIKTMQDVIDKMGMRDITIVFGQTEASPGCTMSTTDDTIERRVATVGRDLPGCENKIVDTETGETLGPGKPGEFCSRGYHIMKGYYKMPEATRQAIDKDGWLHTGDIAMVDEDGYYKITGRLKDMIIRGGENIYPKEIEDFLYHLPEVSDVQVVGIPSKKYGEEIMAFIVLKEGKTLTEEDVKNAVTKSMARHKTPAHVAFVKEFPMTASDKIQKFKLREMAVKIYHLEDAAGIETA